MSRIGRKHIAIPAGVEVKVNGHEVTVKGPKGTLTNAFNPEIGIEVKENEVIVTRPSDDPVHRSLHGLTRTLVSNMVTGCHETFKKELEVNGVGYRVAKQGKNLVMNLGFSHQVIMAEVEGITVEEVREKRPPEPYKGKGIKYTDEVIIRKEGKAGKGKK